MFEGDEIHHHPPLLFISSGRMHYCSIARVLEGYVYTCELTYVDIGVLALFCFMSSIKQIGFSVPTLCRKMTKSPVPTRTNLQISFCDKRLICFWLATLLVFILLFGLFLFLIS